MLKIRSREQPTLSHRIIEFIYGHMFFLILTVGKTRSPNNESVLIITYMVWTIWSTKLTYINKIVPTLLIIISRNKLNYLHTAGKQRIQNKTYNERPIKQYKKQHKRVSVHVAILQQEEDKM